MNRIILLLISLLLMYSAFAQEEVWGYQSFGGEIGGGLVFKLDLENDSAETVYSFDYSTGYKGNMADQELINAGNGLLYGTADIKLNHQSYYNYTRKLFSFSPDTDEIILLSEIDENLELAFVDKENLEIYFWKDVNQDSEIYKYEILIDTLYKSLDVSSDYGNDLSGNWIEEDGKFYFFTKYAGENERGTFLEYDRLSNTITKIFDFDELKTPQGSLLVHENGNYYGVAQRGGENNQGSIFKLDPKGGGYEKLVEFNEELGTAPTGESIIASDGCIYGFTRILGEFGKGCIYKYTPSTNKLESVYSFHPQSDFMTGHIRSYRLKEIDQKLVFVMLANETVENKKGYLMSFDLETKEMNIAIDFHETKFNRPAGSLTELKNQFYAISLNDTVLELGGIIKLNEDLSDIKHSNQIVYNDNPENGHNPIWLQQAGNGNIYGITAFGGDDNKGILFAIDPITKEFFKLKDMNEFNADWRIVDNSFLLDNGNILGFIRFTESTGWGKPKAFEFNPLTNEFDMVFEVPDTAQIQFDIKLNSRGNLYYSSLGKAYELDLNNYSLSRLESISDSGILNIYEAEPDIYYSCTNNKSVIKWNRQTNQIDSIFHLSYFGTQGLGGFNDDIFVSKMGMLNSTYRRYERPSWNVSFSYNLIADSTAGRSFLGDDFYTSSYKSYMEYYEDRYLILGQFSRTKEIQILDQETGIIREIALEKSPYYLDGFWDWGSWEFDGGNVDFDVEPSIGLIKVKPKENQTFWTGVEDSIWYNKNNWYRSKLPVGDEKTIISGSATYFPYVDTLIEISDLEIQKNAEIIISPYGALSCSEFENRGALKMYANEENKASFISIESSDLGKIQYFFQTTRPAEKLLALPVKQVNYIDFDSTKIWQYDQNNWQEITDTNTLLTNQEIYKFKLNTTPQLQFSGDAFFEDAIFEFSETGLQPIPNPYVASLNWDELNLSNLSHQAHYRFNEEDSTFSPYIDGLGGGHPLVQPLDVVWVKAEQNETVEFKNSDLMHDINYEAEDHSNKQELVIAASFGDKKDLTYIRFNTQATAGFDKNYDATKLFFSDLIRPMVFTWAGDEKVSINQLPDTTMMDLSVLAPSRGNYQISIEENLNFDFVLLEDLILHTKTDLLQENYNFEYFPSDGNYPFKLYFKEWVLEPLEEDDIQMYFYLDKLVISSIKQVSEADISFFDLAGRVVFEFQEQDFFQIEKVVDLPAGHYIIQVRTGDVVKNLKIFVK